MHILLTKDFNYEDVLGCVTLTEKGKKHIMRKFGKTMDPLKLGVEMVIDNIKGIDGKTKHKNKEILGLSIIT